MVKTQNTRKRSFGVRSLSVVLALLLVLSTCVVVLSASIFTASALEKWYIAGSFNNYGNSGWSSSHQIYGSSGSVTIDLTGYRGHKIYFKAIAVENGNKWCTSVEGASFSNGTSKKLGWDNTGDSDMYYVVQNGPVTFTISNDGTYNYLKVSESSYPSGEGGEDNSGRPNSYSNVPVNSVGGGTSGQDVNIFWANATYFDYLSDEEYGNTKWLKPLQAGTGFDGAYDEWYPFFNFNRSVVKNNAGSWTTPLYFGNFCNTGNTGNGGPSAYATSSHHMFQDDSTSGYANATNSDNVVNFNYHANNSNGLTFRYYDSDNQTEVYKYQESYQGLMAKKLSNGRLMTSSNTVAPYFDAAMLGKYAKVINSSFPFTVTDKTDTAGKSYKFYEFDSKNAKDNVYFTWATNGNETYPTAVNYGGGTTYGVKDGYKKFMGKAKSGDEAQYGDYGIFPFNNASDNNKGDKSKANENLNYGFGIRVDMKFRLPSAGDAKFEFSGDDDLWAYITDENGNSMQVLDMGGSHKMSTGYVDFRNTKSHVDYVYSNTSFDKKFSEIDSSFNFDPSATYTLTVFYMERGLIESNAHMTFTMAPAGNQVKVDKTVETQGINSEKLQTAVKAADSFNFTAYEATSEDGTYSALKNKDYYDQDGNVNQTNSQSGNFVLKDAQSAAFLSQYTTGNYAYVAEGSTSGTNLSYSTRWTIKDPINNTTETGTGLSTVNNKKKLQKTSGTIYDYAELDYSFVNTPVTGAVTVTKNMESSQGGQGGVSQQDQNKEFDAIVEVSLDGGASYGTYPLEYKISDDNYTQPYYLDDSGQLATGAKLKHNRTLTFGSLPAGAIVAVTEIFDTDTANRYEFKSATGETVSQISMGGSITVPSKSQRSMIITNSPLSPNSTTKTIEGTKTLDGQNYTGRLFGFKLDGIAKLDGDVANAKDTSSTHLTVAQNQVTNGTFTFPKITFTEEGVYRYHVYEDLSYLIGRNTYDSDIYQYINNQDGAYAEFLVTITVAKNGTELSASDPVIVPYETTYPEMVAMPGAEPAEIEPNPITIADFNVDPVGAIAFKNEVQKGSITINKTNQAGENVSQTTFTLYKVDEDFLEEIDGMSDIDKYDAILALDNSAKVSEQTTNGSGIAEFNDLLIYEDGYTSSSQPAYQNYCLIESANSSGYNLNKTPHVFKFPTYDQEEEILKYHYEFDYVNGKLRMPDTAGSGMTALRYAGMFIVGMSLLTLAGFVLYRKRLNKSYSKAKHYK